ncbi:MAG: hypothetical protein WA826_00560 [Silvibacterium sp.]
MPKNQRTGLEYFDDNQGFSTGSAQAATDFTGTYENKWVEGLLTKPRFFDGSDGLLRMFDWRAIIRREILGAHSLGKNSFSSTP